VVSLNCMALGDPHEIFDKVSLGAHAIAHHRSPHAVSRTPLCQVVRN